MEPLQQRIGYPQFSTSRTTGCSVAVLLLTHSRHLFAARHGDPLFLQPLCFTTAWLTARTVPVSWNRIESQLKRLLSIPQLRIQTGKNSRSGKEARILL